MLQGKLDLLLSQISQKKQGEGIVKPMISYMEGDEDIVDSDDEIEMKGV